MPGSAIRPWIPGLVGGLLFLGLFADWQLESSQRAVVAQEQDLVIHRFQLERLLAGSASASALLRQRLAERLLARRLDLELLAAEADRQHLPLARYLAPLIPGGASSSAAAPALQAELRRLRGGDGAGTDRIRLPALAQAQLADADWAASWTGTELGVGATADHASAPPLLLVVDASCEVCASQIRDLDWAMRRLPAPPELGVLVRAQPGDASAQRIAGGIAAAAEQHRGWDLLRAIACSPPPAGGAWDRDAVLALARQLGLAQERFLGQLDAVATRTRIDRQQGVVAALVGSAPLPRLYLDRHPLGGYCPREALVGILASAQALVEPEDLLIDLPRLGAASASAQAPSTASPP